MQVHVYNHSTQEAEHKFKGNLDYKRETMSQKIETKIDTDIHIDVSM